MSALRSRLLPAVVTLAATSVAAPLATPAHGATSCRATAETRNSWHRVPTPVAGAPVAADADDPCTMTAIAPDGRTWASTDGGSTWAAGGTVPVPVRTVFRDGLPNDVVIAVPQRAGLYVSHDDGRTWTAATGMSDVVVSAVAPDPASRATVWAVGAHSAPLGAAAAPTGSVFSSTDAGRTWIDDARGLPIHPDAIGRVGAPYNAVFANDTNSKQLWERADTGAFTPSYGSAVKSIAVSPLKGGGSELYAAGPSGVVVSRDGGNNYSTMTTTASALVAAEYNHFTAFLFVAGGTVRRSTNGGRSSRAVASGLPADCAPTSLVGDHGDPSSFLLQCSDGTTYRYRSDGSDLSDLDTVSIDTAGGGPGVLTQLTPQPMRELAMRKLPDGQGSSASIAFDGTYLYYARGLEQGVVHRIVAATGEPAPDIHLKLRRAILALTYDSKRHLLYLADDNGYTHQLALRTGKLTTMFAGPYVVPCQGCLATGSFTFDAGSDEFVFINDGDSQPKFFDRAGRLRRTCLFVATGATSAPAFAAIVASGDGGLYAEDEDDSTVYRLDASCHVTAVYQHLPVSEAPDENDAMACDTTSFPEPAIWIRDAESGTATAYAVPDGYCALATSMSVTAPLRVTTGNAGMVCTHLRRLGTGAAIPDVPVQLFVANRLIGALVTDAAGAACASYRPTAAEAGRRSTTAATASTHARQPVIGAFLGTKAYRPASAHAELAALDPGRPAVVPPRVVVPPPAALPQAPVAIPAPPVIVAPPAPPAPPAPQPQPLPQAHPGAQPGAAPMGQPGAAFQPEQEAEAATANIHSDEFHARPAPVVAPDLRIVLPVGVALAAAVARRRRASRVRSQVT
jgi:hypothetical protein